MRTKDKSSALFGATFDGFVFYSYPVGEAFKFPDDGEIPKV